MELVGIAAGICTSVSLLPQLVKMIKTKKADDISLFYLVILLTGLALWTVYGFMREDVPIIVTNALSFLLNATLIILGVRYKKHQ